MSAEPASDGSAQRRVVLDHEYPGGLHRMIIPVLVARRALICQIWVAQAQAVSGSGSVACDATVVGVVLVGVVLVMVVVFTLRLRVR